MEARGLQLEDEDGQPHQRAYHPGVAASTRAEWSRGRHPAASPGDRSSHGRPGGSCRHTATLDPDEGRGCCEAVRRSDPKEPRREGPAAGVRGVWPDLRTDRAQGSIHRHAQRLVQFVYSKTAPLKTIPWLDG